MQAPRGRGKERNCLGSASAAPALRDDFRDAPAEVLVAEKGALLRRGAGEVAFAAADEEAREAARGLHPDLELVPLAVVGEGRGAVADAVLSPQLQRDALEGVVHLRPRRGE